MEQVDFLLAPFNFQKLPKILIHDYQEAYIKSISIIGAP